MHIAIANVLETDQRRALTEALGSTTFVDGGGTAGALSAAVKRNLQADPRSTDMAAELVREVVWTHPIVHMAARPKSVIGPTFSRYTAGHSYGAHIDEPVMDGRRTDLAFTLFLSEPASYAGGELVIDGADGETLIKLGAGHLYLYPATTLHRVAPVTSGERLAAVGWIRSFIRRADHRELLFDLDTAYRRLFAAHGKTEDVDLLAKTLANLIRQWCDD